IHPSDPEFPFLGGFSMCDFAADADAARQLLVGRVLTVERVRQLNAKDYFYQMLKDNPEMLKIYPGIENELLKGAIDCHIHAYPNFKMIWFPTFTSLGFWRGAGHPERGGVRLVSESGEVLPEVVQIMEMAAAKKVGIGFGHTDFKELLPLAKKARELGVRATLDHPLLELNKLLLDEMKQLAELGVYVGTYCQPMIPSLYQPVADPMETIRTIKEIGPK